MEKKKLLQKLEQHMATYRWYRPATADLDIDIFRRYCTGNSACEIATELYCSDSTVYRALRRVQDFLREQDAASLLDLLRAYLAEWATESGDRDSQSLLELLYRVHTDCNDMSDGQTHQDFADLYSLLSGLSEQLLNNVYDAVYDLCMSHEKTGFTAGIKVGVRLCNELGI